MLSSRKEANVQKALDALASDGYGEDKVSGLVCHVGREKDRVNLVQQAISKMGGMDLLVSNAAANPFFGHTLDVRIDQT